MKQETPRSNKEVPNEGDQEDSVVAMPSTTADALKGKKNKH